MSGTHQTLAASGTGGELAVAITVQDRATVLTLRGEYTAYDAARLRQLGHRMLQAAAAADPPWVIVDLSHVTSFGAGFLEILVAVWCRLKSRHGSEFAICGLTPFGAEVLRTVRLDRLWNVYASRDEALQLLSAGRNKGAVRLD